MSNSLICCIGDLSVEGQGSIHHRLRDEKLLEDKRIRGQFLPEELELLCL